MNIIQLIPGTANFVCGNCVRDNALVHELRRRGDDVLVVPLYLPLATEDADASDGTEIFMGGVNVYLQQKLPLFRHTPRWLDAMLDARGLLRWSADHAHMTRARELGELTLSMVRGEAGRQEKELDRLVDWLATQNPPDLICLTNALLIGLARRLKERLRAPVVCTLQGEDTFLDSLPAPFAEQSWGTLAERASEVDGFVAVSGYYAEVMQRRLGLPSARIRVIHNGINLEGYETTGADPEPPAVGYLARMTPAKGLSTLVEAFIRLKRRGRVPNLKLRIAGSQTAGDRPYVKMLTGKLGAAGMLRDVEFLPNLTREEKLRFLRSLSVFSTPATYGEAFGLYVLEALAAGVPVVQPRHAAFPEVLAATGGGLLVEPDNPEALAAALEELLLDRARARALGAEGRANVLSRFGMERMAGEVDTFHRAILAGSGGKQNKPIGPSDERACPTNSK